MEVLPTYWNIASDLIQSRFSTLHFFWKVITSFLCNLFIFSIRHFSANKPNLTFDISLSLHRKHKCFPSKVWCKQALVWAELKLNFSTTIKALLFKKTFILENVFTKKVRICLLKKLKFVTPKFVEAKARRLLTRMSLCIQTPLPLSLFRQPYYTQIPKPLLCVHQIEENHTTGEFTFKICIKILTIRGWLVINRSISIWGLAQLTCRSSFLVFFTRKEIPSFEKL